MSKIWAKIIDLCCIRDPPAVTDLSVVMSGFPIVRNFSSTQAVSPQYLNVFTVKFACNAFLKICTQVLCHWHFYKLYEYKGILWYCSQLFGYSTMVQPYRASAHGRSQLKHQWWMVARRRRLNISYPVQASIFAGCEVNCQGVLNRPASSLPARASMS